VCIDVAGSAHRAGVAMEIGMADVDVGGVRVQVEVGMGDRASLVFVLVGMRVRMPAAVAVRVEVHAVGVVGVHSVGVILMGKDGVGMIPVRTVQVI
jgi:hypothetical protein